MHAGATDQWLEVWRTVTGAGTGVGSILGARGGGDVV